MSTCAAISRILFVACVVFGGVKEANAWEYGYQAFFAGPGEPDREVTVVLHAFCRSQFCGDDFPVSGWSDGRWVNMIQDAIAEWNDAGANFAFRTREVRPTDDPCNLPGAVVVILATGDGTCPGDGRLRYAGRTEFGWNQARIYISVPWAYDHQSNPYRILVHEFGHVVGLGHPDEAGQNVQAVMNSVVNYNHLQPDDIAGIRAIYGTRAGVETPSPSETLTGFLENPRNGSSQSGIGIISGWVCEADEVMITIITETGDRIIQEAAYGTERGDTAYTRAGKEICGDTDNGFSLLFNWNILKDGTHAVLAEVDGQKLGRATVTVTTLDGQFPKGLSGRYVLEDFPSPGKAVVIEWEESLQNFVITDIE